MCSDGLYEGFHYTLLRLVFNHNYHIIMQKNPLDKKQCCQNKVTHYFYMSEPLDCIVFYLTRSSLDY